MATKSIAIAPVKVSDVVKKELWLEERFCRTAATVTVAAGMQVGQVLAYAGGKWAAPTSDFAADGVVGILVDETVVEKAAGDNKLAVLVKGPAVVYKKALNYGGADAALVDAEFVKLGIRVDA